MRRYLQNNIDFLKTLIFKVFSILSHSIHSKVFQDEYLLNDYGIFGKSKIKNSLCCGWKNSFGFSDTEIFSVLRVWILFTVNMDHPVTYLKLAYYTYRYILRLFFLKYLDNHTTKWTASLNCEWSLVIDRHQLEGFLVEPKNKDFTTAALIWKKVCHT